MMKKFGLVLFLVLSSFGASTAFAVDNFAVDPVQIMLKNQPSSAARGMIFVENVDAGVSMGWIRYSHTPGFNKDGSTTGSDYWDWSLCDSWSDSHCPAKDGYSTDGRVILGSCINSQEIGCLEKLRVFNPKGEEVKLNLIGPAFAAIKDTPELPGIGIPRSSSPQLFSDDSGTLYLVRAGIWVHRDGLSLPSARLDVDVNPVVKVSAPALGTPHRTSMIDPRTQRSVVLVEPSPSECLAADTGVCYKALVIDKDYKFGVDVRVPNLVSGWIRGRVSEPTFEAKVLNSKSQVISVTAKPAVIPIAGGWSKYSQLPEKFIEKLYPSGGYDPNPNSSYFLIGSPSQGERGMDEYVAWAPYFKEKAITTLTSWSFGTNLSGGDQDCLKKSGLVIGFVAANASVYSSNPPTWDAQNSTLAYRVGAPHFDEKGNENVGTYTLAMPLTTIQCLYKQSSLPPSATVSISYGSDVVEVATVSLKSDSGWVYFSANGFHYSNPTIKVKIGKAAPVAKAQMTTSAQVKVQWCARGNAKKKVTGLDPVCPKGYKKVSAP